MGPLASQEQADLVCDLLTSELGGADCSSCSHSWDGLPQLPLTQPISHSMGLFALLLPAADDLMHVSRPSNDCRCCFAVKAALDNDQSLAALQLRSQAGPPT